MKRTLAVLLLISVCLAIFARTNNQTVFSADSEIYKKIEILYINQGYAAPSSSGPWSGNELLHMMERIDRNSLSYPYAKLYDNIMEALIPDATCDLKTVAFKFSLDTNLEMYFREQAIKDGKTASEAYNDIGSYLTAAGTEFTKLQSGSPADLKIALEAIDSYNNLVLSRNAALSKYFDANGLQAGNLTIDANAEKFENMDMEHLQAVGAKLAELNDIYSNNETGLVAFGATLQALCQEEQWYHGYQYREPLLKFKTEVWALDNFYGYFGLGIGDTDFGYLYALQFNTNATLITGIPGNSGNEALDKGFGDHFGSMNIFGEPMKAIVSVGGDRWNFTVGRDKLSWGNGETGNLMLSDSFPQHSFARFTTYHDAFKYSLLGTIYPYYNNIYTTNTKTRESIIYGQSSFIDGYKSLIAHRLEATFWKIWNVTVTEACMFKAEGNDGFKLAMINPFGFMHNEYVRTNGNSLLVFESDVTPVKGLNVYMQYAVDDFALPGQSDTKVPSATGFLAGIKGTYKLGNGFVKFSTEFVKTDPFLYLRGTYEDISGYNYGTGSSYSYGYGYDAIYRHFVIEQGLYAENKFITYKYGNDVNVLQAKFAFELPEVFEAGFAFFRKSAGIMDIHSPWGVYKEGRKIKGPATENPFAGTTGAVEHENIVTLSGTYHTPVKNLDIYGYIDFISFNNYNNVEGVKLSDVQATLGVSYSI